MIVDAKKFISSSYFLRRKPCIIMEKTAYPIHPKFCCDLSLSNKEHAKAKALEEKSRNIIHQCSQTPFPSFLCLCRFVEEDFQQAKISCAVMKSEKPLSV